jgi:hypothetical protein
MSDGKRRILRSLVIGLAGAVVGGLCTVWLVMHVVELTGGESQKRPRATQQDLLQMRSANDARSATEWRTAYGRLVERIKTKHDQYVAGKRKEPATIDILVISSGGDYGAFGAGFLKGWHKVPPQHPMALPEFDAVSGVSTGTLIAPFAFLGDEQSIDQLVTLFRNPQKDWVKQRGLLYFLPDNISFAEVPGLERVIDDVLTVEALRLIAKAGADGRILAVNTTNVDEGTSRVFNLVAEAQRALDTGQLDRLHNIMLASAGIPGVFPFRMIDGQLYVDGGVTGNIIYGGQGAEDDKFAAVWQEAYPNLPIPKMRMWVIFNNQFRPLPEATAPNWLAVVRRSLETATRSSTAIAVRHLYAMAEITRLKRKAEVEVHIVSIPDDWSPPVAGTFAKETMNSLADLGEKMGADPSSWSTSPPR